MPNSSPLTVALVCDDSLDRTDGVQQYTITVGEWLRSRGHAVHYLTSTTERRDLANIHVLGKNVSANFNNNRVGTTLPAAPGAVRALLRREAFDVIHVQMPYSPLLAGQIIQSADNATAVVGTFHIFPASPFVSIANKALGLLVSLQLKRFDAALSVSRAAKEFAWQSFRLETEILPNVIELKRFTVPMPRRKEKIQIVFLGRLVERKGCMHLLRALAYLRNELQPAAAYEVRIGGKGALRAELEAYAKTQQLTNVYFDGFVPEEDKVAYLAEADIAVFPSTGGESFGISLLEAMAATPGVVLAGNNPGYASVLGDRPHQLFDPNDTDTFAHLLARYIARKDDRASAHQWQTAHVAQFDIEVVGKKLEQIYSDALRSRQS